MFSEVDEAHWYATYVISLPPLSLGGIQLSVTLEAVISSYSSGSPGGPGRSVIQEKNQHIL